MRQFLLRLGTVGPSTCLLCLVCALLVVPEWRAQGQSGPGGAVPVRFLLTGDLPNPVTVTGDDLATYPQRSVEVQERDGTKAAYEGVALIELLKRAGCPTGGDLKGKALASYVLAVARDGYAVTFTLAELEPAIGGSNVIVANKRDGKPLSSREGPLRIISASDKKPARSVRMLDTLRVVLLQKGDSGPR